MKRSIVVCAIAGLVFSSIAWLLSLLLADALHLDELSYEFLIEKSAGFEQQLNEAENPMEAIANIESANGVILLPVKYDSTEENQTPIDFLADGQFVLQDELVEESVVLTMDNGQQFELLAAEDPAGFFTQRELLHLALQCLATLATVLFAVSVFNNKFKLLENAVLDIESTNQNSRRSDPFDRTITALQDAKHRIHELSDAQKSVATDHRDLLASVAHEFRNPLARLQFANEMAMERTGSEQKALFEEANAAATELDDLVRETLRYSRLSNMDRDLTIESVSIEDLFRDVASSAQSENDGAVLKIQYPENHYVIAADRRLTVRALSNLISNGLRFAKTAVTLNVLIDNDELVFQVLDDGPGIDFIHHDKLFDPFYRADRSRSRDSGGFGLGLSIVKSICSRHGARVGVSSSSEGSCFSIRWAEFEIVSVEG